MPPPSPNEAKHQARALELNSNIVNAPPIKPSVEEPASLSDIVNDKEASWSFSKEGGTGAMLVKSAVDPSGGAAIKIEGVAAANQVQKSAQLMEVFFENAQGEAPFNAPRVKVYGPNDNDGESPPSAELKAKLEDFHEAGDESDKLRVGRQLEELKEVENGNAAIVKMDLAKGPTFNKLPQEDKIGLLKSEQMGKMLGRALPVVVLLHENDHLGVDGGGAGFKANPTNMTFDPNSGQPSLIDLSTGMKYLGDSPAKAPQAKLGQQGVANTLNVIHNFQKQALESPESFEEAVEMMASGQNTPFKSMMGAFTNDVDGYASMLSPEDEDAAENELTHEDKRRFAANLLVGTVAGMEYAKQNMGALKIAAKSTHETKQIVDPKTKETKEVEVEHFYNEEELEALEEQLESMDVDDLKQKAELRMDEMAQKRKQGVEQRLGELDEQANGLAVEARELDERIKQLEKQKKGLLGKVKSAYQGNGKLLTELRERRQNLEARMNEIRKESHSLMNTEAFNDAMKQQADAAKPKVAVAPKVQKVGGDHIEIEDDTKIQVADNKPDVELAPGVEDQAPQAGLKKSASVGEMLGKSSSSLSASQQNAAQGPKQPASGPNVRSMVKQYEKSLTSQQPKVKGPG